MSGCGCTCERVVVHCGAAPVAAPPAEEPVREEPPREEPPTPPSPLPCARLLVRFDSIRVTKSESYGWFGEPGVAAEWRLTVTVNDQSRTWSEDDVRDGRDFPLGWDFMVDLINQATTISIRSSGYEDDLLSANDPLPSAERTHGSSDNWGIGATRQLQASNADFNYTLNYTVSCLQSTVRSFLSRRQAVEAVRARREAAGLTEHPDDEALLGLFVGKLAARSLQLAEVQPELLVWEGATSVQQLVPEVFPTEGGEAAEGPARTKRTRRGEGPCSAA